MKKLCSLLLIVLLIGSMIIPASADVLWEPVGDKLFDYEKATPISKTYYVPEGLTVDLYSSPKRGKLLTTMEPGDRVYVGFSQEFFGTEWGVGYTRDGEFTEGWFRLGRLQREYDHDDFVAEFGSSFTKDAPVFTREDIDSTVYAWTYPGSGLADGTIPAEALESGYNDGKLEFHQVYTDPEGGRWGYVGYYMGHCGWVWLDDPTNPEPPYRAYHEAENTVTNTYEKENEPGSIRDLLPVIILAAVVVSVTDMIANRIKKRRAK